MKPFGKKLTGAMLVFAMTAGLAGCGSGSGAQDTTESSESSSTGTSASGEFDENSKETEKKVKQIESLIDKYFYFEEDAEKREESYYDGIMAGLDDPYSVYYTPEEFERLQEDDGGEYVGIGATVSKDVGICCKTSQGKSCRSSRSYNR